MPHEPTAKKRTALITRERENRHSMLQSLPQAEADPGIFSGAGVQTSLSILKLFYSYNFYFTSIHCASHPIALASLTV